MLIYLSAIIALNLLATQSSTSDGPGKCTANFNTPFAPDRVRNTIRNDKNQTASLTLVAAHRGIWKDDPENSWNALSKAGFNCGYEIVEADVKDASNGPVVFHDLELDRVTDGHGPLKDISVENFQQLSLRNRFGKVVDQRPMSTKDLFEKWAREIDSASRGPDTFAGSILALDMKASNPDKVWGLVVKAVGQVKDVDKKIGRYDRLSRSIIYKIEARSMPTDRDVVRKLQRESRNRLFLIIVLNPNDKNNPQNEYKNDQAIKIYGKEKYVLSWEVTYKYNGSEMIKYLNTKEVYRSIGAFSTYYDFPTGVGVSAATCCSMLKTTTDIDINKNALDYRARWDWIVDKNVKNAGGQRRFNLITTDRPDLLVKYLETLNLRNTSDIKHP